ncbi:uncharacterized protein TNCV_4839061 [Trichonephila clavipes]|nr:uncharacterized protein TNCV_4839061 [Trichonephila clavipes]
MEIGVLYSDDILFVELKRVFGKLWIVLELTGIFVFEKKNVSKVIQGNVLSATTLLYFRTAQEIIFPSVAAILYCSNCYFLLLGLRSIKSKLEQQPDMCSEGVRKICKQYFSIIKGVEKFEDLFSAPVFILVVNNFCIVSLIVMDMLHVQDWISKLMVEAVFYCLYFFVSLGVLTICAANIPLEMQRIKSILLNKMSASSFEGGLLCNEKYIELLLKRDVFILTSCNVFQFDRCFLLKALVSVVAQAIVVSQLVHSIQIISSSDEDSSLNKQPESL